MTTYGSLFAGIEGFGKGFTDSGMIGKWAVEIDPSCRAVIRRPCARWIGQRIMGVLNGS